MIFIVTMDNYILSFIHSTEVYLMPDICQVLGLKFEKQTWIKFSPYLQEAPSLDAKAAM